MSVMKLSVALALALALGCSAGAARAQDAEAGQRVFSRCRACHQVGENARNLVGPVLNGLFGRKAGSVEGYSYSDANRSSGIVWDEAAFADYIKNPKAKVPGTKMVFEGLRRDKDVADLAAYLRQFDRDGKKQM